MRKFICVLVAIVGMVMSTYAQIPTSGLVASYSFDGTLNDASGIYNLSSSGSTYETGAIGYAFKCTGSEECSSNNVNFRRVFDNTNSWSVNMWFNSSIPYDTYTAGMGDPSKALFTCDGGNSSPYKRTWILTDQRGIMFDRMLGTGNGGYLTAPYNFVPNTWYHVSVNFDGAVGTIYINGTIAPNTVIGDLGQNIGNIDANTTNVTIGGNQQNNVVQWKGLLDQVRVYNRVLTVSEVSALYNEPTPETVTDIDGNVYNIVTIGTQTWMKENLKTTKYRNGDVIGTTTPATLDIRGEISPKYQWAYNGIESYVATYGRLYTWFAATDNRNICPNGWHLSTDSEWKTLEIYLGMTQTQADATGWRGTNQGTKIKSTSGWIAGGASVGTDVVGFTALPAGQGAGGYGFGNLGTGATWWNSEEQNASLAWSRYMNNYNNTESNGIFRDGQQIKKVGLSIRCVKDSDNSIAISNTTVNAGQAVEIPITVSDLMAADNVISYQFDIEFDSTVLVYTGSKITGTLAAGGTLDINSTTISGKLSVGYINTTPIIGAGNILVLQFNAVKADTTQLMISKAFLNTTPIVNLTEGTVIVKDVTAPTAAITYNDADIRYADVVKITATFSEPMLPSLPVKITFNGAATLTATDMTRESSTVYSYTYTVPLADGTVTITFSNGTDLWSNVIVSSPTSGSTFTIKPLVYGDVDEDTKILAYDAALTLQRSVGLDPLPAVDAIPWELWRDATANVDGVAGVTANDAAMILQYSIGKITTLDAQGKKSANLADITVEVIDNEIVFFSTGELLGLNISVINANQILGTPTVTAENFLSAFNIIGSVYNLGLCTAYSPADGAALLKIPYTKNGSITFTMNVNTEQKTVTVDLFTGIVEFMDENISIYPNPVKDVLRVNGLNSHTTASIYNINGKLMQTIKLNIAMGEINVTSLPAGLYVIKLQTYKTIAIKRIAIE